MSNLRPFHLAIPVKDLDETRSFYRDIMGFEEGRSSDHWVDFNFYGHQFVIHLLEGSSEEVSNPVDGKHVPVPHFGVVLNWEDWENLADRLRSHNTDFVIEPYTRFEGEIGEQATMFFRDPSGNPLEFKAFKDDSQIFAK
ncbi:MAG: VOC family protein [Cyclobacteriaceae bacterium]